MAVLGKALADITAALERMESGLARHDAAGLTVAAAMTEVRDAMDAVADGPPVADGTISRLRSVATALAPASDEPDDTPDMA